MIDTAPRDVPEVFPVVCIDTKLGETLSDIDIDLAGLTEHLRKEGMSDERIADLEIHFMNEPRKKDVDKDGITYGIYEDDDRRVEVYNLTSSAMTSHAMKVFDIGHSSSQRKEYLDAIREDAAEKMNRTLIHELDHAVAYEDEVLIAEHDDYYTAAEVGQQEMIIPTKAEALSALGMIIIAGLTAKELAVEVPPGSLAEGLTSAGAQLSALALYATGVWQRAKDIVAREDYDTYLNDPLEKRAFIAETRDVRLLSMTLKSDASTPA